MDIKETAVKNEISPSKTARAMGIARLVVGIITIVMSFSLLIEGLKRQSPVHPFDFGFADGGVVLIAGFVLLLAGGMVMIVCNKVRVSGGCIACTFLFGIGAIISLVCGWRIDAEDALIGIISLSPGARDGALLVIYSLLLVFSAFGIILNASNKSKYFVAIPVVVILVLVGYSCSTSHQSIIRDGEVFAGLVRIADDRYLDESFVSTGRNRKIAEIDGWEVYDVIEDPSHTFLRIKPFMGDERYIVREDYHIPTEGKVNCVYIEGKRVNDKETLAAFDEILTTEYDAGTSCHLSNSAGDWKKWKYVHHGFGDCPVGTDYSIYGIAKIDSRWAVLFQDDVGEKDENGYPVTYHEIDPKYNEVFDKFTNW